MKNVGYSEVLHLSIQSIEIFLRCYEVRSFTRVAEEFNFTASMVSKTIRQIEELLGYKLFERNRHRMEPTAAADVLAGEWRQVNERFQRGIRLANASSHTQGYTVRVSALSNAGSITGRLLDGLGSEELAKIDWRRDDMSVQANLLERGECDMIVSVERITGRLNPAKYCIERLFECQDAVFVPRAFPIFAEEPFAMESLADYPFIALDPVKYPENYELLLRIGDAFGFSPQISTFCDNTASGWDNLRLGRGLYVANLVLGYEGAFEDVRVVPLGERFASSCTAAWSTSNENPLLPRIVESLRDA